MATMVALGNLIKMGAVNLTLTPAQVAANTTAEQTFTLAGAQVANDIIISINKPTSQAGLGIVNYRVSANNQIAITFSNNTAAPITPTAGEVYKVVIARRDSVKVNFSI